MVAASTPKRRASSHSSIYPSYEIVGRTGPTITEPPQAVKNLTAFPTILGRAVASTLPHFLNMTPGFRPHRSVHGIAIQRAIQTLVAITNSLGPTCAGAGGTHLNNHQP